MCHTTVAGCAAAISYNHITVYKKSKEKYIISCIPECRKAIDDYINGMNHWGISYIYSSYLLHIRKPNDYKSLNTSLSDAPIVWRWEKNSLKRVVI
jgi:hypothetical protein